MFNLLWLGILVIFLGRTVFMVLSRFGPGEKFQDLSVSGARVGNRVEGFMSLVALYLFYEFFSAQTGEGTETKVGIVLIMATLLAAIAAANTMAARDSGDYNNQSLLVRILVFVSMPLHYICVTSTAAFVFVATRALGFSVLLAGGSALVASGLIFIGIGLAFFQLLPKVN